MQLNVYFHLLIYIYMYIYIYILEADYVHFNWLLSKLKLTFRKYPAIHTNYIISHCTTLEYNHNI